MFQLNRNKKIVFLTSIVLLGLIIAPTIIFAQGAGGQVGVSPAPSQNPNPVSSAIGNALSWIAGAGIGAATAPFMLLFSVALFSLQAILSGILSVVAYILNNIFYYNVVLNPISMPTVHAGWVIVRDIANAFFILVILWIAFTIIFNLGGKWGGGKLLVRVLIIAFLVNFSLTIVSAVFGIANVLAIPFRDTIASKDIAGFIQDKVKFQSILATPTQGQLQNFSSATQNTAGNCGFAALTDNGTAQPGCLGGGSVAAFAGSVFSGFINGFTTINFAWSGAVASALSSFFLLLLIASFIGASAILFVRIIMMVFLSILAPAAFLAFMIPGGKFSNWWNVWWGKVWGWAFVAPIFYFLLVLSLKILDAMTSVPIMTQQNQVNFAGNLLQIFPFIVFLSFLWASIFFAKKLGVTAVGEAAINITKSLSALALGAATGGTALLAARGAAKVLQPEGAVSRGVQRLAETKGLRWIGGAYPQRMTAAFMETQRKKVEDEKKKLGVFANKDQAIADFRATISTERKIAWTQVLTEKKWDKDLTPQEITRGLELATRYGMQMPILESNPHLATTQNVPNLPPGSTNADAINAVVKKIKNKEEVRKESFTGPIPAINEAVLESAWLNATINDLSEIAMKNRDLMRALQDHIDDPAKATTLKAKMNPLQVAQIGNYLAGALARGRRGRRGGGGAPGPLLGWTRPRHW